jgi:hypothetical protein
MVEQPSPKSKAERLQTIVHEEATATLQRQTDPSIHPLLSFFLDLRSAARASASSTRLIALRQNALVRKGLIPHKVLLEAMDANGVSDLSPATYAAELRDYLRDAGCGNESKFLDQIIQIIQVGPVKFSLRIIFPEIEEMFRRKVYEPDADGISTFREARFIVLSMIGNATPTDCLRIFQETDPYLLAHLAFLDHAYSSVSKLERGKNADPGEGRQAYLRYQRSFKYVGNRNEIIHGLSVGHRPGDLNDKILINVLTLYTAAAKICAYLAPLLASNGNLRLDSASDLTATKLVALRNKTASTFRLLANMMTSTEVEQEEKGTQL